METRTAKDLPAGSTVSKGRMTYTKLDRGGLPWLLGDGVTYVPDGLIDEYLADGAVLTYVPDGFLGELGRALRRDKPAFTGRGGGR